MLIKPSDEAMTSAMIDELCHGRHFCAALAEAREIEAAKIAKTARQFKGHKAFRHVAEIPQDEYYRIALKYGQECWDDREFVRDFQRFEPALKVHDMLGK